MSSLLPRAIRAQLKDPVTVSTPAGSDGYGEQAAASTVLVKGRVVPARANQHSTAGREQIEDTLVILPDVPGLTVGSILTLPDGSKRKVKRFSRPTWPNGAKHLEVVV